MSPSKYIKNYGRTLKIKDVLWSSNLFGAGKGHIFVAREKRNGDIIIASYLVDVFCLGVKDTFYQLLEPYEYEEYKQYLNEISPFPIESVDPNYAFNIIYGAVEYAEDLGIEPHKGFANTEYLLDAPEDLEYIEIEFGQDGKPCYYHYDGDNKAQILSKLDKTVGIDGYTFVDGQPFLDEINTQTNEEFYFDLAVNRFEKEEEFSAYLFFVSIIQLLHNKYVDNIEELDQMFRYDKSALLKVFKDDFGDGHLNIDDPELKAKLLSSTEKYLIFQDASLLEEPIF